MSAVESLGKYEIRRQLGRGAMGTVYEGFDPVIERIVAIKTVRLPEAGDEETAEEIARFRREAQAAGRLTHPNIVGVFDYGETSELAYIVMEYVDGPPLKSLLDKNERFPLTTITRIMEDLLAGLQFSHERGVVHRDIKPANLMLTKSGQAKIADFGIARIESSSMTQAGTVLGTPAYMSPEQFMGQVVDARSDIYSSGVLLYQLLTGERPFEGSMSAIMHKALNTEAPSPSQISVTAPRPFDGVVRKAMAKRPDDRYASAAEFLAAIRIAVAAPPTVEEAHADGGDATMVVAPRAPAAAAAAPITSSAPRPAEAPAKARKSSVLPIVAVAGVVAILIFGGVGYYLMMGRSGTPVPEPVAQTGSPGAPVAAAPTTPGTPPVASTSAPPATPPPGSPVTSAPAPAAASGSVPPAAPASEPAVASGPVPPAASVPLTPVAPSVPVAPLAGEPSAAVPPSAQTPPASIPPVAMVRPPQPVTPTTPEPAPGAAIRSEIVAFVSRLGCSMFDGDVRDGAVQVTGIGGRAAIDSLRQKLNTMGLTNPVPSLRVTQVEPAFCPWEDLLRPIAKTFGDAGNRLSLRLGGDPAWLVKDDYIRPRLTMADFRGEMHVDYLDRQGNVLHLYPMLDEPAQHVVADPPHVFEPGEALSLGEPGPNSPGWQVDEPYGTDVIIAVASEDTLFDRPRPTNIEKATAYLRDLRKALEAARSRGARITATAMAVETRRK